jgi:hypothetical protein
MQCGLGAFALTQHSWAGPHLLTHAAHPAVPQSPRHGFVPLQHVPPSGGLAGHEIATVPESPASIAAASFVASFVASAGARASTLASVSKYKAGTASQPTAPNAAHVASHVFRRALTTRR